MNSVLQRKSVLTESICRSSCCALTLKAIKVRFCLSKRLCLCLCFHQFHNQNLMAVFCYRAGKVKCCKPCVSKFKLFRSAELKRIDKDNLSVLRGGEGCWTVAGLKRCRSTCICQRGRRALPQPLGEEGDLPVKARVVLSVDGPPVAFHEGVGLFKAFFVIALSRSEPTHAFSALSQSWGYSHCDKSEQMMTVGLSCFINSQGGPYVSVSFRPLKCVNDVRMFEGVSLLPVQVWDHSCDEQRRQRGNPRSLKSVLEEKGVSPGWGGLLILHPGGERPPCPFTGASYRPTSHTHWRGGKDTGKEGAPPPPETVEDGVPAPSASRCPPDTT